MRTITLELLRHGPAHNQLLSPLTDYLALCENHSAVSLRVPFEHNQMMYRLRALCYSLSQESLDFQLKDTARVIGELLSKIPGLTADLNRHSNEAGGPGNNVTHLRLILSSSELALLPFELALAPNGCPGAGQPLVLQPQAPVCITRETRRIPEQYMMWPKQPKILFVFASPPGFDPVPAPAHLLALRHAIAPWLALSSDMDDTERSAQVAARLSVAPNATVATLEQACASGDYTHIHILAHGIDLNTGFDMRFGLALHAPDRASGYEVVSGERLATILRTPRQAQAGTFNRPAVVTLASCNSGNVGSVAGVGASIGHALHEAGIPMVIASQFPLSFGGSVMLVQDLYEGLLWGEDPRKLLVGLRRRLHSHFKDSHDWASLTAYTSLPPDFDAQLADAGIQQSMLSINVALRGADRVLTKYFTTGSCANDSNVAGSAAVSACSVTDEFRQKSLEMALGQVVSAKKRMFAVMDANPTQKTRILGQLASTHKREAQMRFHAIADWNTADEKERSAVLRGLEDARNYYWEAQLLEGTNSSMLVQYLSLTILLNCLGRILPTDGHPERDILSLWLAAQVQTISSLETEKGDNRAWFYGNLAELYLLAPLVTDLENVRKDIDFAKAAVDTVSRVAGIAGTASFHNYSTRRQILRYCDWYSKLTDKFDVLNGTAREMLDRLPNIGEEPEWNY